MSGSQLSPEARSALQQLVDQHRSKLPNWLRRMLFRRPRSWHRRKAVKATVREWQRRGCQRQRQGFCSCAEAYYEYGYANRCGRCSVLFVAGVSAAGDAVQASEATQKVVRGRLPKEKQ